VHCKDLPAYINRDDYAGLVDFPGEIIKAFQLEGWRYHSRVTIWKDPVIEMQRTKNHGLLHRNFTREANACRQGMADYLIVFRKWPLEGQTQVTQQREPGDYIGEKPPTEQEIEGWGRRDPQSNYSIAVWQRYASPVWFDVDQTKVLNYRVARDSQDEKHICPLQLDVIARSIDLWTNPGDVVFSPFAGIGSEGYEALRLGRKFIGVELKRSYYDYAIQYLREMAAQKAQPTLFDWADQQAEDE
jgi:DNA modification methylase